MVTIPKKSNSVSNSSNPLGKEVPHSLHYNPGHLYPIPRIDGRQEIGLGETLPFQGTDVWNAYEISWLNTSGRPEVAIGRFVFPGNTPNLIESKSIKLYLNSLNLEHFESSENVRSTIETDLTAVAGSPVAVHLTPADKFGEITVSTPPGRSLDNLDISVQEYRLAPELLATSTTPVEETVFSNLLRTNCPVTGQPDWGTVVIRYQGPRIDPEGLLKYIVSYREHTGFHENCVERIFVDISEQCNPAQLLV
ncbi:MAG: NADPH-dependent 7-cyano-7-deazaguanine reductase QueF, partial [Desulfobacterales bacterium]|nr:NADPH-dependent 7-cyano-7-deazaguanine reductase QueF [Desulfobacterales bacterium]